MVVFVFVLSVFVFVCRYVLYRSNMAEFLSLSLPVDRVAPLMIYLSSAAVGDTRRGKIYLSDCLDDLITHSVVGNLLYPSPKILSQ